MDKLDQYNENRYEFKSVEDGNWIDLTENINLRKKKSKSKINIEEGVILNLLNPYIQTQLCVLYGNGIRYCIDKSEIIHIDKHDSIGGCDKVYEVSVVIYIKGAPKVKKVKIDLVVKPNGVTIKSIKE